MTSLRLAALLALSLVLAGVAACSDDGSDNDTDSGSSTDTGNGGTDVGDGSGDTGGVASDYPAGPYGTSVDAVIANHVFQQIDGTDLSFGDLRDAGKTVLFLNTAAGWCTACREEQPAIEALYGQYAGQGLEVLVTVFEDNSSAVATLEFVESWRDQYSLSFPVVLDEAFVMQDYYDASATPMNMVVNLRTMEIVYISTGEDLDTVESLISALL